MFTRRRWTWLSARKSFFKVVLPEIMPGILSGFLMAFTYSLD